MVLKRFVWLGLSSFIRHFTLELASVAKSCLMGERGGRQKPASGMSSKPTTEMVRGIWIPLSSKARIAPNVSIPRPQKRASGSNWM